MPLQLWRLCSVAWLPEGSAPSLLCPHSRESRGLLLCSAWSKLQHLKSPGRLSGCTPDLGAILQHPPLLLFPCWSCSSLCCSFPPLPLFESLSKSQSCAPHVKTHQLTVLVYLMQLRMASFMPLLTWRGCKHTLPLHVDKSDLFGAGFHCVFGRCQGENQSMFSCLFTSGVQDTTSVQCFLHWLLAVLLPRTAAQLIHKDLSHKSIYLLGISLGPCSYLSKSIKSVCDCTWHLWSGLDMNPWRKAVCELFNLLSIPGPCIKGIRQYGAFSSFERRSVSALLELSESRVFGALNFVPLFQIHWSAIMGDQCKQCLLPSGPEIFLINLLFSSLLSLPSLLQ